MKKYFILNLCLCCCAAWLLCGCQTPLDDKPRNAPWTLSELENRAAGSDPIEPFNRAMFSVQHVLMEYPVDWIGRVYTSILPRPVIKCVNNLCLNLEFPARFISALLRAEWRGSGHEFLRFLANSTLGIAGLFDVGYHWFDLHSTDSDFGQTFHTWKIDPGCTLILPFLPRVNCRDALGFVFDYALDAKTYIPYSSAVMLNQVIVAQELYHNAVSGSADPYKSYREVMVLRRELQNRLWQYRLGDRKKELLTPPAKPEPVPLFKAPRGVKGNWHDLRNFGEFSPVLSTLQVALWRPEARNDWWYMPLSIFNSDFANRMKRVWVKLPNGGEVACGFWKGEEIDYSDPDKVQPEPKLVVLLPGVGGTHDGNSTMALAEMFHKQKCSVLTLDCAFSGSFMVQSNSGKLPGNVAYDAKILKMVLKEALKKVEEKELCPELPELILAGYSFGGLYTMKIAEMERIAPELYFDRYVAINPPVSLEYASKVADSLAQAGSKWSEKQCFDNLTEIAGRMVTAANLEKPSADKGVQIPLFRPEEEIGRFVAGLYFRLPLRHILHNASSEGIKTPLKTPYSWWSRNDLYLEIDKVGFKEYARNFVSPQFPGETLEQLYAQGDVRTFKGLKNFPRLRVIHAWDDPLLAPEHRRYLDRTFGKRITWFSRGGHLGNMHLSEVHGKIIEAALK